MRIASRIVTRNRNVLSFPSSLRCPLRIDSLYILCHNTADFASIPGLAVDTGGMSERKKPSKKSLEYVRPTPGHFELQAFPGVVFHFRKVTLDDEPWVLETFGKSIWEIMSADKVEAKDLCRLWFHFLDDTSKSHFKPEKKQEMDYDSGEMKEVLYAGWRQFMRAIDGGLCEILMVSKAFLETILSARPLDDLHDEALKKRVLSRLEKQPNP